MRYIIAAVLAALVATSAAAQTRIVVPFAPGGTTDLAARVVAEGLARVTERPVVVENRPGGNLQVALNYVARQPSDGETIFIGNSGMLAFRHYSEPAAGSIDPMTTLRPVSLVVDSPMIMMVAPELRGSPGSILARMRLEQERINYGVVGRGSSLQMAGDMFIRTSGLRMTAVQYTGAAPAMLDLTAGRISMIFDSVVVGMQNHAAGRAAAVAVTSSRRSRVAPDMPTMMELGIDMNFSVWQGLFVTTGTPDDVVLRLNTEVKRALALPEVSERLLTMGFESVLGYGVRESETAVANDLRRVDATFRGVR